MNVFTLLLFAILVTNGSAEDDNWNFGVSDFLKEQTNKVNSFFEEQKIKLEMAINSSYSEVLKVQENINSYVEEQKKIIHEEVNSYVDGVKESERKMIDSWSYVPDKGFRPSIEISDAELTVPVIIARHGYICETHTILSQGYFLNIHRIPRSKRGGNASSKTVLLQHGIFASSMDWILNGPEKALAYVLADAGYDVWMANIRGNRYSKEHAWWTSDSKEYWNFSWHDIALYDVPAIIDHIRNVKGGNAKISYIGHSMGTTILFTMLNLRPEYNSLLKAGIALAPVVFMSNVTSPIKSLAPIANNVAEMEMLYGSHEFIPKKSSLGALTKSCEMEQMDTLVCNHIVFYICGYDEAQFNKTLLPVFLSHLGSGTSWKTAVHFAQEIEADGKYQKFDYGAYYNEKIYGSETPPEYDLSKVTLPITLFWAKNDLLSSEKDVKMLHEKLPATTEMYLVPHPEFNHLDYLWAVDAPKLINEKVLSTLSKVYRFESNAFKFGFGFK